MLLGLFVWGAVHVTVDSALLDEFDESDDAYVSTRLMEEKLDGVRPLEIMLEATDGRRASWPTPRCSPRSTRPAAWLRAQDAVLSTTSPTDYLHESWARMTDDPEAADEPFRAPSRWSALYSTSSAQTRAQPDAPPS